MNLRLKRAATVILVNAILIVLGMVIVEPAPGDRIRPNALNKLNSDSLTTSSWKIP
jgi:hypothetical protein